MFVLSVNSLSRKFGARTVVDSVSFGVKPGELVALIGPNGAGKTTIFNMIHGQLKPNSGSVTLNGINITALPTNKIAQLGVSRTFQVAETFSSMTVLENIQTALMAHNKRGVYGFGTNPNSYKHQAMNLLEQVGMQEQAGRPCNELAYGDVKRAEFAMALAGKPQVLLMDEPTAGMAPSERKALMELVASAAKQHNIAVLFTEHSMDVVFDHATNIIVLANGSIVAQGNAKFIQNNTKVQQVYFGNQAPHNQQAAIQPLHESQPLKVNLLKINKLCAWYGSAQVVFDVNMNIGQGEVVALLGRNGAGKSTVLGAVMAQVSKRSGVVKFMDKNITTLASYQIAKSGLGYVPQERRIFTDLSVLENLNVAQQPSRFWPHGAEAPSWSVQSLFKYFPNLEPAISRPADQLSGGEQQMLSVARTLMGNPYVILLDEPSEGVAPIIVDSLIKIIKLLKQRGVSVLLAEQNIEFASQVADRAYVLEKGEIRYQGAMHDLLHNQQIRRQYLSV